METSVVALIADGQVIEQASAGDAIEVVLPATPYYVESGGQVADTGVIAHYSGAGIDPDWEIEVTDTRRPVPGLIVHAGKVRAGKP
jgi:alanyl-tRNA synthetase